MFFFVRITWEDGGKSRIGDMGFFFFKERPIEAWVGDWVDPICNATSP
jgi:hypothetical protein